MSLKSKIAIPLFAVFALAGCATVSEEKAAPAQEFKSLTGEARLAFWECVAVKTLDPDLDDVGRIRKKLQAEGETDWNAAKEQKLREVVANIRCAQQMGINPDTVPGLR